MKFCYFDESGRGKEPYLVLAGIVVDAQRMHVTKEVWADFLETLSTAAGRTIKEFHSREFYRGNGVWHGIEGTVRTDVFDAIIQWVAERKHKCVFSGINKTSYKKFLTSDQRLEKFKSNWCACALHCSLQVQKHHQSQEKVKGHSVLIFDREVMDETDLTSLIYDPPDWTDTFYSRKRKQASFDQIVDVPFFADSKHILLSQVADLFAYILRTHAEMVDGLTKEKYTGEAAKMAAWSELIAAQSLPRSTRYPTKGRCEAAQLFWDLAPKPIRDLGK